MNTSTSILEALLQALPALKPQLYFKASLTALSHAMEDRILAGATHPLIIANFQQERFYRQEAHRYRRLAKLTDQIYVLAAPDTNLANFTAPDSTPLEQGTPYALIPFSPDDPLAQEWHLVVMDAGFTACLICRERHSREEQKGLPIVPEGLQGADDFTADNLTIDQTRQFEGIWTFDWTIARTAARLLLERICLYRPELSPAVEMALQTYCGSCSGELSSSSDDQSEAKTPIPPGFSVDGILPGVTAPSPATSGLTPHPEATTIAGAGGGPFVERLVTYLQAGQYKLLRAYQAIAKQEQKERLINSISTAIRRSLNPGSVFTVAVQELGQSLHACRCLIYRCKATDAAATIEFEFLGATVPSLVGQRWPLHDNPLFQEVVQGLECLYVGDAIADPRLQNPSLQTRIRQWEIERWLLVPVSYQGRLLGVMELHYCRGCPAQWDDTVIPLIEAIATQIGLTLIQAEAYANLEDLNEQLAALERTRSNLIAITGHELRTPLSTIQVCLESLAMEPDMAPELRQIMLNSALADAERLRALVGDFLTLSQLESGRVTWNLEPLSLQECVDLALSGLQGRHGSENVPKIMVVDVAASLPLIRGDGERLVEVLSKLLDNACKFTEPTGMITIRARSVQDSMVQVTVADTGRGVEPHRLETIFDRFYQEEGALRRSAGGTGLGLAICRQIIKGLGGQIWAESAGRGQGSQFHFTIPTLPVTEGTTFSSRTATPQFLEDGTAVKSSDKRRSRKSARPKSSHFPSQD